METLLKSATSITEKIVQEAEGVVERAVTSSSSELGDKILTSTANANDSTSQAVQSENIHTDFSTDDMLSCSMSVDTYKENPSKLIFLDGCDWSTNHDNFRVLMLKWCPGVFFDDSNKPAKGISQYFNYFRGGFSFTLNTTVPLGAQGSVVLSYIPNMGEWTTGSWPYQFKDINTKTLLAAPHIIHDVRCGTEVTLTVPYMNSKNYVKHSSSESCGAVIVWILSKLKTAADSGVCTLSLYGSLLDADFQSPKMQGKAHGKRRHVVPPKEPVVKNHVIVDSAPGTANCSNTLNTTVAESTALVGESSAIDYASAGSRPAISDLIEVGRNWSIFQSGTWNASTDRSGKIARFDFNPWDHGILAVLMKNFSYFKGSFEVKVLFFASTMSNGKYQISWSPERITEDKNLPQMSNLIYAVSDLGCSSATLVIPFVSQTWRRKIEGIYGTLFMNVVNKLTHNSTAPSSVDFVLLVRLGQDFQMFCPRESPYSVNHSDQLADQGDPIYFINYEIEKINIHSESHTLVNNFYGRLCFVENKEVTAGQIVKKQLDIPWEGTMQTLKMFTYWTGELIVNVINNGESPMMVCHSFDVVEISDVRTMSSLGLIIIPPKSSKHMLIPFYSVSPLQLTIGGSTFGNLFMFSRSSTTVDILIGLRNPNLFVTRPFGYSNKPKESVVVTHDQGKKNKKRRKEERRLKMMGVAAKNANEISLARSVLDSISDICTYDFGEGGYVRDLTKDGDIESNPGPEEKVIVIREGLFSTKRIKLSVYRGKRFHVAEKYVEISGRFYEQSFYIYQLFDFEEPFPVDVKEVKIEVHNRLFGWEFNEDFLFSRGADMTTSKHWNSRGEKIEKFASTQSSWIDHLPKNLDWIRKYTDTSFRTKSEWKRDLIRDGDVEANPGPAIFVVGKSKSGKSSLLNKFCGKEVSITGLSSLPYTRAIKKVEFGNYDFYDTPEKFKYNDEIHMFVWVRKLGLRDSDFAEWMDIHYPNWASHCLVVGPMPERVVAKQVEELTEDVINQWDITPYFYHYAQIVYQDRGLYKHYGVKIGKTVFHMSTNNILKSAFGGTVEVIATEYMPGHWEFAEEHQYRSAMGLMRSGAIDCKFSVDNNCETYARSLVLSAGNQGSRLKWCLMTAVCFGILFDQFVDHSPTIVQKLLSAVTSNFYSNLECSVMRIVIRTVVRICCYLILYCHSPNLLNTGVLVALMALDVTSFEIDKKNRLLIESIVNGSFDEFCNHFIDIVGSDDLSAMRETIPNFNMRAYSDIKRKLDTNEILDRELISESHGHPSDASCSRCLPSRLHTKNMDCNCPTCFEKFGPVSDRMHKYTDDCECEDCLVKFGPIAGRHHNLDFDKLSHETKEFESKFDPHVRMMKEFEDQHREQYRSDFKNNGPKNFNEWTTAAKNIQWWLDSVLKIFNWIREKVFPSDLSNKVKQIEILSGEISYYMALADKHIVDSKSSKDYLVDPLTKERHSVLVDKISYYLTLDLPPQLNHLNSKLNSLMMRLQGITLEPGLTYSHRVEPLGIWIQGDPGTGKSFLCHFIVSKLQAKYGWTPFSQPIGSEHMDGYLSQEIHIFDDLGQNRDEEDMALMCNLISSVPFIVPKAECTSKGIQYNGKVVLVTTNKRDFTSIKLSDSGALKRRFPIVLEIRPKQIYSKSAEDQAFCAVNATNDGSLKSGRCWEMNVGSHKSRGSTTWIDLDPDILMDQIYEQIDSRLSVCKFMNQGKPRNVKLNVVDPLPLDSDDIVDLSKLFPEEPTSKMCQIKDYIGDQLSKIKTFIEKYRIWFVAAGALGTIVSLISFVLPFFRKKEQTEDESPYGGRIIPSKMKNYKIQFKNQGAVDMRPIVSRLVNLKDEYGDIATALALGGKEVITYGHDTFTTLSHMNDEEVNYGLSEKIGIQYSGSKMDLAQYVVDMPQQFKSINSKIHVDDYKGDGYLVWKDGKTFSYMPVFNIHPTNGLVTQEGTSTEHTYTYVAKTWKGSCGAVLVGLVSGNPKILGVHIAGSNSLGVSARLYPMRDQGKASLIGRLERPYHQPRRTNLQKSPVYDEHCSMSPAVLSRNDPRLEIEIDDVTKLAAHKYVGNHFDPPREIFEVAKACVVADLQKVVRPSSSITFEKAIDSSYLPIDWQTSSGHKYNGRPKSILVQEEAFKDDVFAILNGGHTYFTTYLKDELRPNEKIRIGKTRAIESSNFDYVVAYRMVMGDIMKQLFEDEFRVTGFCPGLNVYSHFDSLYDNIKPNVLNLDFKGYDGSLSPQIMEHAVDILASFHSDPAMVKLIHHPTIYSTNYVSEEVWKVDGGMCSGSPCTTLLNTIVNKLVNTTILLSYGQQREKFYVASFGDDTVISCDETFDVSDIEHRYKEFFGMSVTSADKVGKICWLPREKMEFLKRTPSLFPRTQKITGKLDLQNMRDHLSWTRGHFQEQLDSFYMELVLHGEEVYSEIRRELEKRSPNFKHHLFESMWKIMYPIVMVF